MSRRTLFIAAAVAVVVLLGLVFVRNQTDFAVYYAAGKSLLSGRTDLYSPDFARGVVMDYRYLPFFILVFAPLSLAPVLAGGVRVASRQHAGDRRDSGVDCEPLHGGVL